MGKIKKKTLCKIKYRQIPNVKAIILELATDFDHGNLEKKNVMKVSPGRRRPVFGVEISFISFLFPLS